MRAADTDPGGLDLDDPDDDPPPEVGDGELAAEAAEMIAAQGRVAAALGRRGPGMPGSAQTFAGVYSSRSSGFASGKPLDTAAGCLVLGQFAEEAAGDDDRYPGASDDELGGVICAWERVEAYASSRKHAAAAELIRRRPAEGCELSTRCSTRSLQTTRNSLQRGIRHAGSSDLGACNVAAPVQVAAGLQRRPSKSFPLDEAKALLAASVRGCMRMSC